VAANELDILLSRAQALRATREFFWGRGYVEMDTPVLSPALIPEHTIENFATTYYSHGGASRELYLVPSPEVWMKRLLSQGSGDLFQISKCFRNREPPTGIHHPEFTMLEWYSVGKTYLDSLALQEEYFGHLGCVLGAKTEVMIRGRRVRLATPFLRIPMREAFFEFAGLDLDRLDDFAVLTEAAAGIGIDASPSDDWESLFHRIFFDRVEPRLPGDRPFFLMDYPARLPTLARCDASGRYAERWELFIAGLEIANCYTEERHPERLRVFFKAEDDKKRAALQPVATDWELETIMANGLPASSGNALGLDRLLMVLLEKKLITEVMPFASIPTT
jgi:elongation factor P--(R)-beta-lysine ligase